MLEGIKKRLKKEPSNTHEVPENCTEITTELSNEFLTYLLQCQTEYMEQLQKGVTLGETIEQIFNEMITELNKRQEAPPQDFEGFNPKPLEKDDPMFG